MKITRVELFRYNIPLKAPVTIAIGTITEARNILVRIHTSDGLYGLGEGSPFWMIVGETQETCLATGADFARLLLGRSATDLEGTLAALDRYLPRHYTCKSAFDMALYDLAAKYAHMPLYRYLGGEKHPIVTDETIYIGTPEAMAEDAVAIRQRGAEAIKVKLGTSAQEDIRRVQAIREAIGPELPIRVDANQGWDYVSAVKVLRRIADWNVEYCEQPVKHWDLDNLARVRQNSPVPICADESLFTHIDALRLAKLEAVDYFNIKLSKSGGINNALKINAIAEAAGVPCMIGCMSESRLAITANAHLASARANIRFYDLDAPFEHAHDPVLGGATYHDHYRLELPDTPGHGADLDEGYLAGLEKVVIEK
ncbi:dipeptide epimerase [Rhabdobacter roseus]|uniref:Dipeptide epimerase n=1 Tax=Rhabdobacter roseus TaxID=1655419 RepID=A0A840TT64_9BACT|nr:dipeptide epimerase [Rhabdobacter roseus]MBB5286474.1 L-alanine-DL-glutamate epimerase-like enolase superfamily enzyme [Rhabdobacter roseus]